MTSTGMLGGMPVQGVLNKLESDNYDYLFPPLKQTQNRVYSQDILCKEHLDLILSPTYSPACVKSESVPKLIERGWNQLN